MDIRGILGPVLAFAVGSPLAFFLVFAGVFTDVSSLGDRLLSLALTAGVYAVAGGVMGYLRYHRSLALWLVAPAVFILVWYTTHEPQALLLHTLYGVLAVSATLAGRKLGAATKAQRQG